MSEKKEGKLSFKEKFSVGTGGFTVGLGNQSVRTTGQAVLNMILGINAFWVGVVLAIPLLWDALTDPIMGNISDNFKSKYGRRRPFIFLGAILMGLSFASIWLIPMGWSDAGKLAWFLTTSLLFYTSYTIFSVPFIALTYEMTPDYDERTAVQGFVTFWNRLSEMTYMGLIPLSLTFIAWKYGYSDTGDLINPEKMEGIRISAAIYGGIGMILLGMLPAFFARERLYDVNVKEHKGKKDPFWQSAKTTLQNKAFAILCSLAVFTIIAGVFAANMDWYLLIFYLSDGDVALGTQWKLIVTVGYAVVGIVGIPIIVWLTGKMTKIHGFMFIYGMMVLNAVMRWFVYRPGRFEGELVWKTLPEAGASLALVGKSLIWLDPLTGGMFWIGVGVLGQSLIADVCDDDELKNGHRREGMFGAIYGWAMKASFALSFVLIGLFLEGIGFDPQWGSTRWMSVNAKAENYAACKADFAIADDDFVAVEEAPAEEKEPVVAENTLSLELKQAQISETDGISKAVLTRAGTSGEMEVLVKSSPKAIAEVPQSVVIPDGENSVEFSVEAINDGKARGVQTTTITAWVKGGVPVRSSVSVIDDDGPALAITLDGYEISENGGELSATLTRYGTTEGAATVALEGFCSSVKKKDMAATVTIPETVTIPAGEERVAFKIAAVDNDRADGQQSEQTFFRMRLAMCIGAAGPALLCFVLLGFYPLNKKTAEENRRKLEELRSHH
ncbi:putative symporter YjmB [Pontiella desulfatans]|uniref:Putative symporter YjmB n=1 Tax=Pontiella desulfatans TaxID=2750659 RepID=A0A6C2U631_PONDE|nr:MFS transporter [Pontiella desulfatans]VGO15470.1 putative symporter YjmB [Pontiella desulfatans]